MTAVPVDIVALTRSLVDIDSTTGREGEAGRWLAEYLRRRGFAVVEQQVDDTRFNVFATPRFPAEPALVFSTHFDCVPPFFPSRVEGDRLYGRGSADRPRRWRRPASMPRASVRCSPRPPMLRPRESDRP